MNAILRTAEILDGMLKGRDPNTQVSALYAEVLHCQFESPDFYVAIGTLIDQFERAAANLLAQEKHERARAVYARALDKVRPWLHPHTIRGQNVSGMRQIEYDIDQLFVIGSQMPSEDDVIEPALIDVAIDEALGLQQTLADLDIDPATKLYLLRLLDTLLMALRSVNVIGVEGLSKVFGGFASELARASGSEMPAEAASWTASARKWAAKIGKGMLWSAAFVTAGSHAITDGADVINLLTGPDTDQSTSSPVEE